MSNGYDHCTWEQFNHDEEAAAWNDAHREQSDALARAVVLAVDEVGFGALNESLRLLGYKLIETPDPKPKLKTN